MSSAETTLIQDPRLQGLVDAARNSMQPEYFQLILDRTGNIAQIRLEGRYTLRDVHGFDYQASLVRVNLPNNPEALPSGGEFRFLPNKLMQARVSDSNENVSPDPEVEPIVIIDNIPIFLKELSLWNVQSKLEESRYRIATANKSAVLIQTRASDIHDGQFRFESQGQHDISEEIWYAKVLTLMHQFPGITMVDAEAVLQDHGYLKTVPDIGNLSVDTAIAYYYRGNKPKNADITFLTAEEFIVPFPCENGDSNTKETISITSEELCDLVSAANPLKLKYVFHEGKKYAVEVLADYPVLIDGMVFRSRLFKSTEDDGITFHTFRSLERGNTEEAYVRMDSICINGVQGGDGHCDCRSQLEHERYRAKNGDSIFFLSIRDHEGRGHGEGPKGATLELMRRINDEGTYSIGNGIAAQILYDSTGLPVDRRDYSPALTVFKYLDFTNIRHLVTNNKSKIDMLAKVANIGTVISAQIQEGISEEARRTIREKADGFTGTEYVSYKLDDTLI